MITYKGKKAFKFADLETDCVVTITVDFDNEKLTDDGRSLSERIKDAATFEDRHGTLLNQYYGDYVALFIRAFAHVIGELSIEGMKVLDILEGHEAYGDWITKPSYGVTFDYTDWSPNLKLALQECPQPEERPWKEW